jgi:hypothetical protein
MPKEDRFFDLFCSHARVTLAGAEALRDLLSGRADIQSCIRDISAHEGKADELTRQVLVGLRRSFITPLDRGDIKDMGLGTLLGGWRIVRTMGLRITRLHPVQGFCAEAGGASVWGLPERSPLYDGMWRAA